MSSDMSPGVPAALREEDVALEPSRDAERIAPRLETKLGLSHPPPRRSPRAMPALTETTTEKGPEPQMRKGHLRGDPGAAFAYGSECGDEVLGPPLGAALLRIGARIERERGGLHAGDVERETLGRRARTTAKHGREGRHALRAIGQPAPARKAGRMRRGSRFRREARQTVALERFGSRPVVGEREDHANQARPGSPERASMRSECCRC